jgi:integrase
VSKTKEESMGNRTGYVFKDRANGKWYARVTITVSNGKRRNIKRTAETKGEARNLLNKLLAALEDKGVETIEQDKLTFRDLAEKYSEFKVKPAEYRGDIKVAGLRSVRTVAIRVAVLVDYFGSMKVRGITLGEIERFKAARLATPTQSGGDRSIATVNREVEVLRSMMRYARNNEWIDSSPFENASTPIISKAHEQQRVRVLSRDEESRILKACADDTPRPHLRPLVIAAIDSGCRAGELLKMTWGDVDLRARVIRLRPLTTKSLKSREVPISNRLAIELERLRNDASDDALVFGIKNFQRGWRALCKAAGIEERLTFHDLRHSFATRLVQAGFPLAEIARLLGHSTLQMTFRYSNATPETTTRAASILNTLNDSPTK